MAEPTEDNNIEKLENCQVEWDKRRGVLYVHNKDTGTSVVRICQLPASREEATLAEPGHIIDVVAIPSYVQMPPNFYR